ncbi:MAG: phosphosulfolactate synthase [Pseudomonadota bacterium]
MTPQTETHSGFQLPPRGAKPRRRGITSMIDFGPDGFGWTGGARGISDLLDVAADYIDYAKIYAMNALLIPEATVRHTTRLYLDAGVVPFAGGILFEYAWMRNQLADMISLLKRLGIPGIEISENYVTLDENERHRAIEQLQKADLRVVYEFGRKNPDQPMSLACLGEIVSAVAQHGIRHVTVEQCEIDLLARDTPDALLSLAAQPWFDHVVIEVDPYRFPEQHVNILRDFGPEVNLANVTPGQILRLEGFRRGIGRAVNYSLLSGDASRPAGISR